MSAPAILPAPGARRPPWESRTPGGAAGRRALPGPQLSAITLGSQGRGRAAEHLLESRTPGLGVAPAHNPPASNPGFRASGSEGGAGSSGFRRSPPESRPSLTVTRATVGVAAASRTGRGCAWIGLSGARGGVAGGFALKWLQRCSRSKRKGTRWWGTSSWSLRLPGQTGPDGEVDSGWSLALLSRTSLALRESRDPQGRAGGRLGTTEDGRSGFPGFLALQFGPTGRLALRVLAASPDKGPCCLGA